MLAEELQEVSPAYEVYLGGLQHTRAGLVRLARHSCREAENFTGICNFHDESSPVR